MNFIEALFKGKINNSDGINHFLKINKESSDIIHVRKNGEMILHSKSRLRINEDIDDKVKLLKDNGFFDIIVVDDNYVYCSMVYEFNIIDMLSDKWEVCNEKGEIMRL